MADAEAIWHRFMEAYDSKDLDGIVSLYADDAVLEFPGRGEIIGRPAMETFMREVQLAACPDARTTLITQAANRSTVISEWTDTGINTGALGNAERAGDPSHRQDKVGKGR